MEASPTRLASPRHAGSSCCVGARPAPQPQACGDGERRGLPSPRAGSTVDLPRVRTSGRTEPGGGAV